MNKSILILNTPTTCSDCLCCCMDIQGDKTSFWCHAADRETNPEGKPEWCPLAEMPRRRECVLDDGISPEARGWNACIDEIKRRCGK